MNNEPKEAYFFTFMFRQNGLANKAVAFEGTFKETREHMIRTFGEEWAFQYPIEDYEFQNSEFGLKIIPVAQAIAIKKSQGEV